MEGPERRMRDMDAGAGGRGGGQLYDVECVIALWCADTSDEHPATMCGIACGMRFGGLTRDGAGALMTLLERWGDRDPEGLSDAMGMDAGISLAAAADASCGIVTKCVSLPSGGAGPRALRGALTAPEHIRGCGPAPFLQVPHGYERKMKRGHARSLAYVKSLLPDAIDRAEGERSFRWAEGLVLEP